MKVPGWLDVFYVLCSRNGANILGWPWTVRYNFLGKIQENIEEKPFDLLTLYIEDMKRIVANIRGRVQGVSFRYYTQREAIRLGLTGWVRNESDGSVLVVAEGSEEDLNRLLDFLRQGPRMAVVMGVSANWSSATMEFEDFNIRLV